MAASTGMIKDKKPLEIIWNNYRDLGFQIFGPGRAIRILVDLIFGKLFSPDLLRRNEALLLRKDQFQRIL